MSPPDYKRLFEKSPSLILLLRDDPSYTILDATDAYLAATMTRRETCAGRPLFEVFPDNPDDPAADGTAKLRASLERAAATRLPDAMAVQKYDIRRPDGAFEERFWSPVNAPLLASDGSVAFFQHRVEDVTELVRSQRARDELAREVQRRGDDLERANRELEAFSYSVAHDLRAPLRAVTGFARALSEVASARLDPEERRLLGRIQAGAEQMDRLIDDLLGLSHVGRATLRRGLVDLAALAREAAERLASEKPGRIVEFVAPATLPVLADPGLTRAALENLLANAFKFSGRVPSPRVELGAIERDGETTYFVRDNGAGFDPAYAHKLFGAFQRLHSQSEFPGTGVGLATVHRIVTRHGGRVWAESSPGNGATFFFTLPAA